MIKAKENIVEIMGDQCDNDFLEYDVWSVITKLHIVRESYEGKIFEGKQCEDILKSIPKLNIPLELKPFETALKCLKNIINMCYKECLPSNYFQVIIEFKKSMEVLVIKFGVSVTPKFHIIFYNIEDYYDQTQLRLVKTTDELIESMHQYVHKRVSNSAYILKDLNNSMHGRNQYHAVLHINAYNMVFGNGNKDN